MDKRLLIIGCGTMGQAILTGLIETKHLKEDQVTCLTNSEESAEALKQELHDKTEVFALETDRNILNQQIERAQVILLCTKPQIARQMFEEDLSLKVSLKGKLLISICSGIKVATYQQWLPDTAIIRAMPNTPCKIRQGMTVLAFQTATKEHRQIAVGMFQNLGRCRVMDEKHMDAVTSLSGSGPAFACVILEALADGGVMMGLPREVAFEMAACSLKGAAEMYLQTKKHPSEIKDEVTTPAGCTIAGILCLEDGRIRSTIARAVQEATVVAGNLGSSVKK